MYIIGCGIFISIYSVRQTHKKDHIVQDVLYIIRKNKVDIPPKNGYNT